ncbi:MAG: hypothetical protein Q4F41_08785 [Eubacteriales bacterium]|nr:hypothetical protein [Eubacteriales bacterium]
MNKKLNVYFGANFWRKKSAARPGVEIPIRKSFTWAGRQWNLLSLYTFPEGVTADFCIRIPREEVEVFLEKWSEPRRLEAIQNDDYEACERENPFRMDFWTEARLNGEPLKSEGMCMISWHPCEKERNFVEPEAEELMEVYACDRNSGWCFVRASFRYPSESQSQPDIRTLSITLKGRPTPFPGERFRIKAGETEREIPFTHPVTGEEHLLKILSCEPCRLPDRAFPDEDCEYPREGLSLTYTVSPRIVPEELHITDCTRSDPPRKLHANAVSSACIAAIFTKGQHPDAQNACSSLHFEPVTETEWKMTFYRNTKEELELEVI